MTNTEKLLRAFIKAQGYSIEETEIPNNTLGIINDLNPPSIDYKVTKIKSKEPTTAEWLEERNRLNGGEKRGLNHNDWS